jgi:hypothetical protein
MSDSQEPRIGPVPSVGGAVAVQPVRVEPTIGASGGGSRAPRGHDVAATTGGNLRPAAAQFFVNPDTNDVVIRIKDPTTDQVISEYPSAEVEAMQKYMKQYADTLARHRAARPTSAG